MKVALSSSGKDLDSQIDQRFGRCAHFLIVETDDMSFECINNENIALSGGAGIQSAQFVASKGVKAVITGNCGPNAVRTLTAAGIELFVGQAGTVREAVERFKNGELRPTNKANVSDHYGMSEAASARGIEQQAFDGGRGVGGGRGMGRGMGMCGGKGMGRGMRMPGWNNMDPIGSGSAPKDQELNLLKEQAADLKRQMEDIQSRIKNLEKIK